MLALVLVVIGDAGGVGRLSCFFFAVLGQLFVDGTQQFLIAYSAFLNEVRLGVILAGGGVDKVDSGAVWEADWKSSTRGGVWDGLSLERSQ